MKAANLKAGEEILSLTGLRFVAALYIFLFHIQIRWPLVQHGAMRRFLEQGGIGMSLFFVLSGFVLAYRYGDGRTGIKDYLVNRFARIYPVYAVAALVTIYWIGVDFGSGSSIAVVKGLAQGSVLIFANIFLVQAWFPQFFSYWNDGGSWSISVEVFCYALLPFVLPALVRLSYKQMIRFAGLCYLLGALPGISLFLFNTPAAGVFYSMPIFRLSEFLMGVCVCLAVKSGRVKEFGSVVQALVILVFVAYLGILGSVMPLYIGHNWITLPVIAFMILSLARGKGVFAVLLQSRLAVWLGKVSYSFYSFQVLIILFLVNNHDALVSKIPVLSNNHVLAVVSFLALVLMAAMGHHLIEEPARRWIKRCYHETSTRKENLQTQDRAIEVAP